MYPKILLIVFVFSFFIYPAFSQTQSLISVEVSNDSFEEGQTVVISGLVSDIILDTPVTIQIFHEGDLIDIALLEVSHDGTFIHTVIAQGEQWQNEGEYVVRVSYRGETAATSFEFFKKQTIADAGKIFKVDVGSSGTFEVEYIINGGTIKDMIVDIDFSSLIVIIESTGDGSITVSLPRYAIDAKKIDGTDDTYIILIDGMEVPYRESQSDEKSRVITVEFEEVDSDIEIIGTEIIPEFGAIVYLVLTISIISVIIFSSKKNLMKSI